MTTGTETIDLDGTRNRSESESRPTFALRLPMRIEKGTALAVIEKTRGSVEQTIRQVRPGIVTLLTRAGESTLGTLRENGFAPLLRLLRRAPLIGWALALQFGVSGTFGILMFGPEPVLVALLAFVLALLVLNGAAAKLETREEDGT